jgi:hypothetical protein
MDLARAASYFTNTAVRGWDGTDWVEDVAKIAIMPSDRFISVHEFDTNCQYALVDITTTGLDDYSVIQVVATDQIFLVGFKINDVNGDHYSKFYLLRRADAMGELFSFTKTYAASGTAKGVTRQSEGTFHCDVEHVTSTPSRTFKSSKLTDCLIFMPSDSSFDTGQEIKVGNIFYDIQDTFDNSGFKMCRAIGKNSV